VNEKSGRKLITAALQQQTITHRKDYSMIIYKSLQTICQERNKSRLVVKEKLRWQILTAKELTKAEKLLMEVIILHYNYDNGCFTTVPTLLEETSITKKTYHRIVRNLQAIGLLAVEYRSHTSNLFHPNWEWTNRQGLNVHPGVDKKTLPPRAKCPPTQGLNVHPGVDKKTSQIREENKRTTNMRMRTKENDPATQKPVEKKSDFLDVPSTRIYDDDISQEDLTFIRQHLSLQGSLNT